ncbi:hypothetical protein BASA83_002259 [Batrachochytrium salamandrivorans]|nr:hypothetical protein BASA83_002259 [Batrachochytrium salamandrivorans]
MSVSDISTVPHQSTALDQIDNSCLLHRPRLLRQQARLCQPTLLNTRTLPPSYLLKSHSTSSVPLQRPESPTSIQGDDDDAEDGRCNYDDNDDNYENQEPSNVPLQVSARHHGNVAASMNTASGFRASTGAGAGLRRRSVHSTALSSSVLASPVLCRRIPVRSPYDSSELDILMDHTLLRSSTTLGLTPTPLQPRQHQCQLQH